MLAQNFGVVETILRNRYDFFGEIRDGENLHTKIRFMLVSSAIFLAIYGSVMGAAHSPFQSLASTVKLPLLFLATLMICTPSLHFFNVLFGSTQTILQTLALVLTTITTTSVLLLSFAPITFFFLISSTDYHFFKLLNVIFFIIAGAIGIMFLRQGIITVTEKDRSEGVKTRRFIFALWVLLYAFVGTQMAWTLRPFMGIPSIPFHLFNQVGGNFYADVIESFTQLISFGG